MNFASTVNFFTFSDRDDLTAVFYSEYSISYKELFHHSNQLAFSLSCKGISKDKYIPVLIEDNFLFIKTVIALWYLGAVPVPLNVKLLNEEILSIIDDYEFNFLVTDSKYDLNPEKVKTKSFSKINTSEFVNIPSNRTNYSIPNLEKEAVVIFTSGSAGRPKGVVHNFNSLINSISNGSDLLDQSENDRWLASLPFYHIGGFQIICRSLYYGSAIIIPDSLKTDDLKKSIINFYPTHLSFVSAQLEKLLEQKINPGQQLKISLIGGGFIDDALVFEAENLGWKPYRVYGSSETASFVTSISADEIRQLPQSIGRPLKNVQIKISKDWEILIKSNCLLLRYLNDDEETKLKLVDDYYHTGDLGFVDDSGYLFIEARRTDLIVTGGENVNPIEVEKVILKMAGIKDVCVFPKLNKTWGQTVACVIVPADPLINEKTVKEYLKQNIAGYKIPKEIIFVDHLPHSSIGKLERNKIRKMF